MPLGVPSPFFAGILLSKNPPKQPPRETAAFEKSYGSYGESTPRVAKSALRQPQKPKNNQWLRAAGAWSLSCLTPGAIRSLRNGAPLALNKHMTATQQGPKKREVKFLQTTHVQLAAAWFVKQSM